MAMSAHVVSRLAVGSVWIGARHIEPRPYGVSFNSLPVLTRSLLHNSVKHLVTVTAAATVALASAR